MNRRVFIATTWIKSQGTGKKSSPRSRIQKIIAYVCYPEKTENGKYITGYQCMPNKAVDEFMLKKQRYHQTTGRRQPKNRDVVCYHVRQSFHPDEKLTPEQVNELGRKLAMKITGGNHQFVVCTHTNENHLHNHIIFNAVDINCKKKFDNEFNSSFKVRAMSDQICLESGLSVVENPKEKEHSDSRDIWEDKKKGIDWKAIIEADIVHLIKESKDFEDFKKHLVKLGYEVKGKTRLSVKHPNLNRFMRTDRISKTTNYSIEGISFAIEHQTMLPKTKDRTIKRNNSVREFISTANKTGGLEHWAKIQNIKTFVNTQNYLEKHGLTEYTDLVTAVSEKAEHAENLRSKIKELENSIDKNKTVKNHIINFAKTKKVYDGLLTSKDKQKYRDTHSADIIIHEASKKGFTDLKVKKLPKVKDINYDLKNLYENKSNLYEEYKLIQAELKEIHAVKRNVDESNRDNNRNVDKHFTK